MTTGTTPFRQQHGIQPALVVEPGGDAIRLEKQSIREALGRAGGNRTKAAVELGIYRRLLYAKIKEYGLEA